MHLGCLVHCGKPSKVTQAQVHCSLTLLAMTHTMIACPGVRECPCQNCPPHVCRVGSRKCKNSLYIGIWSRGKLGEKAVAYDAHAVYKFHAVFFFFSKYHKPRTCISARGGSRGGGGGGGGGGVMGVITISNLKSRTSLMPSSSAGSDGPFCLIITNFRL